VKINADLNKLIIRLFLLVIQGADKKDFDVGERPDFEFDVEVNKEIRLKPK